MTIPKIENKIFHMDCLAGLALLPDKSVDMILSDLPYGVTDCAWDKLLPLDKLWQEYKRVLRPGGVAALTCVQPFTTALIQSNRSMYRYCWYWRKNCPTGFANSKKQPMRCIEDVAVFYDRQPVYHPQGLIKLEKPVQHRASKQKAGVYRGSLGKEYVTQYTNYPVNLLEFPVERGLHPTQKPVALFEYLIRTYTDPGALVLDSCIGSGTTAVASIRSGRRFVGFELDAGYWAIAQERVEKEWEKQRLQNNETGLL